MNVGSVTPSRTPNCGAISGHRFYNASTGWWLSRDPIEERGALNVYGMLRNNPINKVDRLGLVDAMDMLAPSEELCKISKTYEGLGKDELGFSRVFNQPFSTYINTLADIQADLEKIKPYDRYGRCCYGKCLKEVKISAHGSGGTATFGDQTMNPTNLGWYEQCERNEDGMGAVGPKVQTGINSVKALQQVLSAMNSKLCADGKIKVSIVICDLGQSQEMVNFFKQNLPSAEVETFTGKCTI
ncbi:MAG: RHS repeat-associated core domain-containing protein [Verrucomicrobiales bacterium]